MSYFLDIPFNDRYFFKDYIFTTKIRDIKSELTKAYNCAISKPIKLKYGDTIICSIPKNIMNILNELYPNYDLSLNDIKIMVTNNTEYIKYENGIPTINQAVPYKYGVFNLFTNNNPSSYTSISNISYLSSDYTKFINEDVYIYSRKISDNIVDTYGYIYAPSFIPNDIIDEKLIQQIGFGIIREGDSPKNKWNETINGIAFNNFLYQSRQRKNANKMKG